MTPGNQRNNGGKTENPSLPPPFFTLFFHFVHIAPTLLFLSFFRARLTDFPGFFSPFCPLSSLVSLLFTSYSPLFLSHSPSQFPHSPSSYSNPHGVRRWGDDDDASMTLFLLRQGYEPMGKMPLGRLGRLEMSRKRQGKRQTVVRGRSMYECRPKRPPQSAKITPSVV